MENQENVQTYDATALYHVAANLVMAGKNAYEITNVLTAKGMPAEDAAALVEELEYQYITAKKDKAKKDMLYGALWCVGGLALTIAHIGFIFWGAIIFGGIQFFRGVSNING